MNHLQEHTAHFGKRLSSYTQSDSQKIELNFEDGSSAICDILIGCDGVKSVVRGRMYNVLSAERPELHAFVDPSWTGIIAYRGLIEASRLPPREDGTLHNAVQRPMMVSTSFHYRSLV